MADEQDAGCARPTAAAAIANDTTEVEDAKLSVPVKKEQKMIHVGHQAPDFAAPGYSKGTFVTNVKLSDYLGKWVVLCFYPGDFTFV